MKRTQANHRTGSRLGSLFRYQLLGTFSFKKPTKETSTLKKHLPSMCRCNKYQSSFEGSRPIKKLLDWLFEALIHWGKLAFKVTQTNSWLKWMLAWYFSLSKKISPEKHLHLRCCFESGQVLVQIQKESILIKVKSIELRYFLGECCFVWSNFSTLGFQCTWDFKYMGNWFIASLDWISVTYLISNYMYKHNLKEDTFN